MARVVVTAVVLALAVGCGDDGSEAEPTAVATGAPATPTRSDVAGESTAATTTMQIQPSESATSPAPTLPSDPAASGELPDPCRLVSDDELVSALGASPGPGQSMAPVPDQRKVCMYPDGTILAIEVAANWSGSLDTIREMLGDDALVQVDGLGEEAYWQPVGGDVGQLLVLEGDVFVGVTLASAGQDAAATIATTMLTAT